MAILPVFASTRALAHCACARDLGHVRGRMVGDMGFSLADFETYIAGLRKPDWAKIFATVIDDHHEMFVRLAKR